MSLEDAAEALGIRPNSVRSRWKAHKIKGERDNTGKIWVWIDTEAANDRPSKNDSSKPSIEGSSNPSKDFEIKALQAHLETALKQLAQAQGEIADLRPRAEAATRLEAENKGLQAQIDIRIEQLAELRRLMAEAQEKNAAELERWMSAQPAKGFFARLLSR